MENDSRGGGENRMCSSLGGRVEARHPSGAVSGEQGTRDIIKMLLFCEGGEWFFFFPPFFPCFLGGGGV